MKKRLTIKSFSLLKSGIAIILALIATSAYAGMVTIHFENSLGVPIVGVTPQYYSGGWISFSSSTDASGNATQSFGTDVTTSFRVNYLGGTQTWSAVSSAGNPTKNAYTTNVTINLRDHTGAIIPYTGSVVQYYSGGWLSFGTTTSGTVSKELLPGSYQFNLNYNNYTQNIGVETVSGGALGSAYTLDFQTKLIMLHLEDHTGSAIGDGTGTGGYYSGGYITIGSTNSSGISQIELLPGSSYYFTMNYNNFTQQFGVMSVYGGGARDTDIYFRTTLVSLHLLNHLGVGIGDGTGTGGYYTNGWYPIGTTDGSGISQMEFLPGTTYYFNMNYSHATQQTLEMAVNSGSPWTQDVNFTTTFVSLNVADCGGGLITTGAGSAQLYSGGWFSFGAVSGGTTTKELLPVSYYFNMTYDGVTPQQGPLTLTTAPTQSINFTTTNVTFPTASSASYSNTAGGSYTSFSPTAGISLFPGTYYFKVPATATTGVPKVVTAGCTQTYTNAPCSTPSIAVTPACSSSTLTAPAGTSYSWAPGGDATQAKIVTTAGVYSVTVNYDLTCAGATSSSPITATYSVAAVFTPTFTVTASAGANGGISPAGATGVCSGNDQSYTITPDAGYHISGITLDGAAVGTTSPYVLTGISADHTVVASFAPDDAAPTYTGGGSQTLTVCENSGATDFSSLLQISDADAGQTETFTVTGSPANGSITTGTPATSNGGAVGPTGFTYTPTTGYSGTDAFTIQVSDGAGGTASTTINVIVNPTPVISGVTTVYTAGTATLSADISGGTWTSDNTDISIDGSSGAYTGEAAGTANIIYTLPTTCASPVVITDIDMPAGAALNFDGVDDYAVNDGSTILLLYPLTVEAWVRPTVRTDGTNISQYPNNVVSNDNPGQYGHGFGADVLSNGSYGITVEYHNGFRHIDGSGSAPGNMASFTLTDGQWYHITTVYTNGEVKTYLGTTLIDDWTFTQTDPTVSAHLINIGKHNDDEGSYATRRFFKGDIDEVRIWNRALCISEITNNMNCELSTVPDPTGLAAYYQFNEGLAAGSNPTITTATDNSGNGNDVTLNGFALSGTTSNWVAPGAVVSGVSCPAYASGNITLSGNSNAINDASTTTSTANNTNFGSVTSGTSSTLTYSINNTGSADFTVSSISVSDATNYTVSGITFPATVSPGGSSTFTITFAPASTGVKNATVTVSNSTCEPGYAYAITGTGICAQPTVPTVSASVSSYCGSGSSILSIASGTLNNATAWNWYSGSCGGTPAGTGASITVSPTGTTTYYVRGEGGCATPGSCGNTTITVNSLPTAYNVTGGGSYCAGAGGVDIGLDNSDAGISYQLILSGVPVATTISIGGALDFGNQPAAGTYTVVATNAATTCSATMTGSASIVVNPNPIISGPTIIYTTGSATLTADISGGAWTSGGAGIISIDLSSGIYTGAGAGTANITYTTPATCTSFVTVTDTTATPAGALNFNGVDNRVDGTNATLPQGSADRTVEAWINLSGYTPDFQTIYTWGNYTPGERTGLLMHGNNLYYVGEDNDFNATSATIPLNTWTHVAFTLTGQTVKFYVNGTLMQTGSIGALPNTTGTEWSISNTSGDGDTREPLIGSIDEVRVWGRVLCEGEIANSMNCQLSVPQTGLVAYYQFNEGLIDANNSTVTTLTDATNVAYSGTLNGTFVLNGASSNWVAGASTVSGSCSAFIPPTASVSTTTPTTFCTGGSVLLSANTGDGLTYQWTNGGVNIDGANGSTYTATTAGSYAVVVTEYGNCTATSTATVVIVNPLPTVAISEGSNINICAGTPASLDATGSSTSYSWSPTDGLTPSNTASVSANPASTTTYVVTGTDANSCSNTASITVSVNPLPYNTAAGAYAWTVTGGGSYCAGGDGSIIGLGVSQSGISYQLYNGTTAVGAAQTGTGSAITFGYQLAEGTYSVIATDPESSCFATMPGNPVVAINPVPDVAAVTAQSVCNAATQPEIDFSGSVPGTSFSWANDNTSIGLGAAAGASGTVCGTADEGGSVTLTAPAGAVFTSVDFASYGSPVGSCPGGFTIGSCNAPNSVSVAQSYLLGNNSATIPVNNNTFTDPCYGSGKSFAVVATYTYVGNIAPFTATNSGATPVTANITVTPAANGCVGTPGTFTITVNPSATISTVSDISQNTDAGECTAVVNYSPAITAGSPNYTFTGATTGSGSGTGSGSIFNKGVTNVTVNAANDCNTATTSFNVTVSDHEFPVFTAPADLTHVSNSAGQCGANLADVGLVTPAASDNCTGLGAVTNNAPAFFPLGPTTVTWTVTDGSGNTTTHTQVVTVFDDQAPTITAPSNISVCNFPGFCYAIVLWKGYPSTHDNCGVASVTNDHPGIIYPVGSTTVTWTVTDIHGNATTATQTVTVNDCEHPTILAMPYNITVCNDHDACSGTVSSLGLPLVFDNCGIASITNDHSASTTYPVGSTPVTWTVTDIHGNTTTAVQTVTVHDCQHPTITAPANIAVNAADGECSATVALGTPVVGDNCGTTAPTNNHASTTYPVGVTVVTWTETDIHGNTTTATQTVTVTDNQPPTITTPANVSVNNTHGHCSATVTLATPATHDNCGVATTVSDHPSTTYPVGSTVVTWTVTDIHGNTATATQTVTVTDNEHPTITPHANISVYNATGVCGATVSSLGTPTTHDNCGVLSTTNDHPSTSYPVGSTVVTWTVTDIHGNTTTATQTVTVTDHEPPTIAAPANISVNNTHGECSATVTLATPATHDNCGVATTTNNHPSGTYPVGTTVVIWTVTDIHGNTTTATQTVTVTDNQPPTITTPANVSVNNTHGHCSATVTLATPATHDNCGVATTVSNHPSANYPVGSTVVTWTVTDIHGNTATATQTVTVTDNEHPTITPHVNISVYNATGTCGATVSSLGTPTTHDNCGVLSTTNNHPSTSYPVGVTVVTWTVTDIHGNTTTATQTVTVTDHEAPHVVCHNYTLNLAGGSGTVTAADINGGSTDNCGIASMTVSPSTFTCAQAGNHTVTLTVTDIHGNAATCTSTVTVQYNPSCSISATPCAGAYTGGVPTNIYLGYGPQTVTFNATATGGTGFTYLWSSASGTSNLSNIHIKNPVFTATLPGHYTYVVTITNSNGCSTTCTVSICVIDAVDHRHSGHILLCHAYGCTPSTLSCTPAQVLTHFPGHCPSDHLGPVGSDCVTSGRESGEDENAAVINELTVNAFPNPYSSEIHVKIQSNLMDNVDVMVYDITGRVKETRLNQPVETEITLGENYTPGIYIIEVRQGEQSKRIKVVKIN